MWKWVELVRSVPGYKASQMGRPQFEARLADKGPRVGRALPVGNRGGQGPQLEDKRTGPYLMALSVEQLDPDHE